MVDPRVARNRLLDLVGQAVRRAPATGAQRMNALVSVEDCAPGVAIVESARSLRVEVMQMGLIRIEGRYILNLDYGTRAALKSWRSSSRRVDQAIALWSHDWMSYYHWLIDIMPKIILLQERRPELITDSFLCLPHDHSLSDIHSECFEILGIKANRVIDTKLIGAVQADQCIGVTTPGFVNVPPSANGLRVRLGHLGSGVGSRIYLRRAGRRRVLNEEQVVNLMRKHGFTVVDDHPRTLVDQIGIFRDADIVVAPHGGALANLLWCRPGGRVLELAGSGYFPDYFRELADFGHLEYWLLKSGENSSSWRNVDVDFIVDLRELEIMVERIIAGS